MVDLDGVDRTALLAALEEAPGPKAAMRLMAALSYLDGVNGTTFADRYGLPRSTVYAWLARFETRPIEEAVVDDPRPGRPSRLDDDQREQLRSEVEQPPTAAGYAATSWDGPLLRTHLAEAYGFSYSAAHARRLLAELQREEA